LALTIELAERSSTKWEGAHYAKVVCCQPGRFDFGGRLAPDAEPGRLQPVSSPMAAIRRVELGWLSPSIARAIISLCSMAGWQS
jgi:hypothetical protein